MAGTAVFTAVGRFGGLIGPANQATTALEGTATAAQGINNSVPANGGAPASGMARFAAGAQTVGTQLKKTGGTLTKKVTLPLVGLGALAVNEFKDFDLAITQAGQKSGATKKQLAQMRDIAIDMGQKTKFSAADAANALDDLAALGFNASDAMKTLPAVMNAAQASGEDLGLTAQTVATSMNAFGLSAKDASHVSDVFAAAANETALDMQGLHDVMANVGEVGSRFGMKMEPIVAWAGRLVDKGVPAAAAGTAIRQSIVSLAAPLPKASALMKGFGLSVRDASGHMKQPPALLKEISKGLSTASPKFKKIEALAKQGGPAFEKWAKSQGLTKQATQGMANAAAQGSDALKDYVMKNLFGVEGAKAFALALSKGKPVLLDVNKDTKKLNKLQDGLAKTMGTKAAKAWIKNHTHMGKFKADGADAVKANAALMKSVDGLSKKVANKLSKTTAARIDNLKGSFESLAITVIGTVAPALTKMMSKITDVVSAIGKFAGKHKTITQVAVAFLGILAALGPVMAILGYFLTTLSKVARAGMAAGRGFTWLFAKGPEGQASRFARSFDTIRLRAMAAGTAMKNAGRAAFTAARNFVTAGVNMARSAASALAAQIRAAAQVAAGWIRMGAQATVNAARMAAAWVVGIIRQAAVATAQFAVTVARIVAGWAMMAARSMIAGARMAAAWLLAMGPIAIVIAAVIAAVALIITHWKQVSTFLTKLWNGIKTVAMTAWNGLKNAISTAVSAVINFVKKHWPLLVGIILGPFALIIAMTIKHWAQVKAAIVAAWNAIKAFITGVLNKIKAHISKQWTIIKTAATKAWNAIKAAVVKVWNALVAEIKKILGRWKTILSNAWSSIKKTSSAAATWVKNKVVGTWNALKTAMDKVWTRIKSAVTNAWSKIKGSFRSAWNWVTRTFRSMWSGLRSLITSPLNKAKSAVSGIFSKLKSMFRGAVSAIKGIWGGIKGAVTGPINSVIGVINHPFIGGMNALLKHIPGLSFRVPYIPRVGRAKGGLIDSGVLPGYTPGRDVHQFVGKAGRLGLSGGEAIMRPEWTRGVGSGFVNSMNKIARSKGVNGVRKALGGGFRSGGILGGSGELFGGGVWGGIKDVAGGVWKGVKKVGSMVWNGAKSLGELFMHPAKFIKDKLGGLLSGVGSSFAGQIAKGVGKKAIGGLIDKVKGMFGGAFSGKYKVGAGVAQWRPVAIKAMAAAGLPMSFLPLLMHRMQVESGGNPNAINNWDINAKNGVPSQGLMQVIPPTFAAYAGPYRKLGLRNPFANIYAAIKYSMARYGLGGIPGAWGGSGGYRLGGILPALFDRGGVLPPTRGNQFVPIQNKTGNPEPLMRVQMMNVLVKPLAKALADQEEQVMLDVLTRLRSPILSAPIKPDVYSHRMRTGPAERLEPNINVTVNNPVAEKASDSIQRRLTRSAQLGIIGGRRTS